MHRLLLNRTLLVLGAILPLAGAGGEAPAAPAPGDCPVSAPELAQPPDDPHSEPLSSGLWYINPARSIWAGWGETNLRVGPNKVLWMRPAGSELAVSAERLDGAGEFRAEVPCCYPNGFQISGLHFSTAGCWRISARSGEEAFKFTVRVQP